MMHWYTVRSGPLQEYRARDRLAAGGIEVFLPCIPTNRPRPGHTDIPLFPGYFFVRYDLETEGAAPLQGMIPPVRVLTFGGTAPPVPEAIIDDLRQRTAQIAAQGGIIHQYAPGDIVAVPMGKTEALGQVIEAGVSPRARVRVLVEFLGRLVEVTMPGSRLEPRRLPRRTRGRGRFIRGFAPET